MKRSIVALLGLITLIAAAPAQAQAPARPAGPPPVGPGEVRGTVLAEGDNAPVAGATITVRSKRDSSLVAGTIAGDDGSFRVQGLRPGTYRPNVGCMGYANPKEKYDPIVRSVFHVSVRRSASHRFTSASASPPALPSHQPTMTNPIAVSTAAMPR